MHKNSLLIKPWIPVIDSNGKFKQITLKELLCTEHNYQICLPRDDMIFACIQFIVAIVQVCFTPKNKAVLKTKIKNILSVKEFEYGIKGKEDWFDLDYSDTPFMQFRGVKADKDTSLDKLLPGVNDGTNKTFVNPDGLASGLCSGCVAIALFNFASNSAGIGGGCKDSLRSKAPVTMLIKLQNIRKMIWANVLHEETLTKIMPWYSTKHESKPNYCVPANFIESLDTKSKQKIIYANTISIARGLFWQPSIFELLPPSMKGACSMCGVSSDIYTVLKVEKNNNTSIKKKEDKKRKNKFNYKVENIWPHPLSPRVYDIKKTKKENEKFLSFNRHTPCWTHLNKFVLKKESDKSGQIPAPVFKQASEELFNANKIQFILGGYVNNQATILDRRHEAFTLAEGLANKNNGQLIDEIINLGLNFKDSLRKALFIFNKGIKDKVAGTGIDLCNKAEKLYYQQSERHIHNTLSSMNPEDSNPAKTQLQKDLKKIVIEIFNQITAPYKEEPKMLKILAIARRSLYKFMPKSTTVGG